MLRDRHFLTVVCFGLLLGATGVLLAVLGNPENSGICVSCFIENASGALGLHDNARMQYLRPELIGFVLGSLASSLSFREFRSRGGSAPLVRLFAGIFLMVGCSVFIGCPIKLVLRLGGGDLTAVAGVLGLCVGVWCGLKGMGQGVDLGEAKSEPGGSGVLVPAFFFLLLLFLVLRPGFLLFSEQGSASQHAPWLIALGAGVILGGLAQRSRFCITGGIRDTFLMGLRSPALWGLLAFAAASFAGSAAAGRFHPSLYGQPGAHLEHLWSFLGMGLVGWVSVLIGGCPFRQLVKAGEGDADAGLVVIGMFIGGALSQSWGIAATAAGVSVAGKISVLLGLIFAVAGGIVFRVRRA